jgi:hypothetical protein
MCGTVDAVTKADTDVADHRSIPGAHFTRIGKRLDKIRLNDNNVGNLAVFDLLLYDGPRVARQSHLIVRLLAKKGGHLDQGGLHGTVAHDFDCGGMTRRGI